MAYFKVVVKGGHCGTKKYNPLTFAIEAKDAFQASNIAKAKPGVKHSAFPLSCRMISREEYQELREVSAYKRQEEQYEV